MVVYGKYVGGACSEYRVRSSALGNGAKYILEASSRFIMRSCTNCTYTMRRYIAYRVSHNYAFIHAVCLDGRIVRNHSCAAKGPRERRPKWPTE